MLTEGKTLENAHKHTLLYAAKYLKKNIIGLLPFRCSFNFLRIEITVTEFFYKLVGQKLVSFVVPPVYSSHLTLTGISA